MFRTILKVRADMRLILLNVIESLHYLPMTIDHRREIGPQNYEVRGWELADLHGRLERRSGSREALRHGFAGMSTSCARPRMMRQAEREAAFHESA